MLSDSIVFEALSKLTDNDPILSCEHTLPIKMGMLMELSGNDTIYPRKLYEEKTKEEKLATLKSTIDITEYQNDLFPMLLEVENGVRDELTKIDNNEEFIKTNLKDIIMTQLIDFIIQKSIKFYLSDSKLVF